MNRFPRSLSAYERATRHTGAPSRRAPPPPRVPGAARRFAPLLAAAAAVAAIVTLGTGPEPVDATLAATGSASLGAEVSATWEGRGVAAGSARALDIAWEVGRLELAVAPGRGVDLVVRTDEAEVRVVGTRFVVDRSAYGTAVEVTRGEVAVRCVDGADRSVRGGERVTCVPVRAHGLLRRARALQSDGAAADALVAVDAALADPALSAVLQDELLALRVALLTELGSFEDAVTSARAYLGLPHPTRAEEIARLAAAATGDVPVRCGFLQALRAPTEAELVSLGACRDKVGTPGSDAGTGSVEGDQ
jgi:hypothetical protein